MSSITENEHMTFQSLTDHIGSAADDARRLSSLRPDQPWITVASKLDELRQMLFQMVGDGHVRGIN